MTRIVYLHVEATEGDLIVLDAERRVYAAISRDGTRYHLIQPLEAWAPLVGDGKRAAGELGCSCQAGVFRGQCYRIAAAEAFEQGRLAATDRTWFDADPEAAPA